MATSTSFGWELPDDTDLVKDGAAAMRTLGNSIDASMTDLRGGTSGQVLKKNSNTDMDFVWSSDSTGMTNPMTTTGDTIYSSSGSTPARLGIGTTGQVLTVSGGVPAWSSPSASTTSYTLLNTGGTSLTGANTITISGLSGYNKMMITVQGASDNAGGGGVYFWLNGDTTASYGQFGAEYTFSSTYSDANFIGQNGAGADKFVFGGMSTNALSSVSGYIQIDGANSTSRKVINYVGAGNKISSSTSQKHNIAGGYYDGTSVISSFTIFADSGNFDGGTVYIYGAN